MVMMAYSDLIYPDLSFGSFFDDEFVRALLLRKSSSDKAIQAIKNRELDYTQSAIDADELSNLLIQQAFFGKPLLIVEGWLVLTKPWWVCLMDDTKYPLLTMLRKGFITLYSRLPTLPDVVKNMAEKQESYSRILADPDFVEVLETIRELHKQSGLHLVPWPDEKLVPMDDEFDKRLREVQGRSVDSLGIGSTITQYQFEDLALLYQKNFPNKKTSRASWLETVIEAQEKLQLSNPAFYAMIQQGNEVYYISRAAALFHLPDVQHLSVAALPVTGFDHLAEPLPIAKSVGKKSFRDLPRPPKLRFEWFADKSGQEVLERVLTPGNPLSRAKKDYIRTRERAIETGEPSDVRNHVSADARYLALIREELRAYHRITRAEVSGAIADVGKDILIDAAQGAAAGGAAGGLIGAAVGGGIALGASAAWQTGKLVFKQYQFDQAFRAELQAETGWERAYRLREERIEVVDPLEDVEAFIRTLDLSRSSVLGKSG